MFPMWAWHSKMKWNSCLNMIHIVHPLRRTSSELNTQIQVSVSAVALHGFLGSSKWTSPSISTSKSLKTADPADLEQSVQLSATLHCALSKWQQGSSFVTINNGVRGVFCKFELVSFWDMWNYNYVWSKYQYITW